MTDRSLLHAPGAGSLRHPLAAPRGWHSRRALVAMQGVALALRSGDLA